ncbi:hypothetical protein Bca52824_064102 [Brassica carinata]|uniref:Uncharacterized protein n=1 Tax=Brassica carinata TaxID=52824 RepID=A0A8X7QHP2_BRACI|nr:hypothetical protein Bca52824_064102 [Brassica carinata]
MRALVKVLRSDPLISSWERTMGEEGKFYSENMTMVVWNMDDYPIPAAAAAGIEDDLGFIRTNIEEVGHRMGFHGPKEIDVYVYSLSVFLSLSIFLGFLTVLYILANQLGVNKVAPPPPRDMTSFLVRSAVTVSGPYGPINFVVIAKAKPKGELDRVLKCLQSRGHTILLIDPTAITGGSFFSVESLLGCARLLRPPPPTRIDLSSLLPDDYFSHGQEEVEEYLEYLEYSSLVGEERIGQASSGTLKIAPFPPFSTPDEIYDKIESALLERGFTDKLSIWVYLDDDKKGTWEGWDKASRRIRMANDITFWARDSSHNRFEGILILFSDQFRDDAEYTEMLRNLVSGSCCIVSVIPTQDINKPESPEWPGCPEWPGLLIDGGGYWVADSLACLS